jgi:hypothetical protein
MESHSCGFLATRVVVQDDPVDKLSDRHMFGLGFGLDLLDEGLLNVQCPALSRSRRLIRGAEKMFSLPPPTKNLLKISEIGQWDINVDICHIPSDLVVTF